MPHSSPQARSALLPGPAPQPVFAETLPDWEFPPSFAAFSAARRRALASLSSRPPVPPNGPSRDDEGEEDTNPGDMWEEVAP